MNRRQDSNVRSLEQARRAKELIEQFGLFEYLERQKQTHVDRLLELPASKRDEIEAHRIYANVIGIIMNHIRSYMASGKIAERDMKEVELISKGKKREFF